MTAFNIFLVLYVVVCSLLALVIMVQNPKGDGLSFTSGDSTQVVGGMEKTGDFLERNTWTFVGALAVLVLAANTLLPSNIGVNADSRLLDSNTPVAPLQQASANNATGVPATPVTSTNTGNQEKSVSLRHLYDFYSKRLSEKFYFFLKRVCQYKLNIPYTHTLLHQLADSLRRGR